ncbi:hypothetical protein GGX14DRAFT_700114 [Mycena pura]|uniref:Uncharacterized protein n=1 Tax=Mycena pura TaxID=153505 RepID=A0AAD6UZN7_9AGAR|nr:hypothetical protein GGX14DRAFT_700114 [Mycena pura]
MARRYGVEIAGLIIRLYFDIPGCIIPVACIPDYPVDTFVFTIAGPCDDDGKKDFYIFNYDDAEPLDASELHIFRRAFASVADFHLNRRPDQLVRVAPRPDREVEIINAFIECGFYEVGEPLVYKYDIDQITDGDDSYE